MTKEFFERDAGVVARDLIGCFLYTPAGKYMIVETESYGGFVDKASHSSRGETKRNAVMWGPPGRFYVYFTYGLHYMLNVVCREPGHPSAVLIRGIVNLKTGEKFLGPAILTKKLGIDKRLNGSIVSKKTGLWIEFPKIKTKLKILKTPRIGVDYAGLWAKKKYRFVVKEFETKKFK